MFKTFHSSRLPSSSCCCFSPQLCLTLCSPLDCRLPGSSAHGVLQARILEWVATFFSRGTSQARDRTHVSCIGRRFLNTEPPGKPLLLVSTIASRTHTLPAARPSLEGAAPLHLPKLLSFGDPRTQIRISFPCPSHPLPTPLKIPSRLHWSLAR